jgi:hypothetical protein
MYVHIRAEIERERLRNRKCTTTMAYRVLEVTIQSAKDLKRVNLLSRMEVYAVVSISGDPLAR